MDNQTYHCAKCGAQYLPYAKNIACPSCGAAASESDTSEYEGFIDRLVSMMRTNKERFGRYVPSEMVPDTLEEDVQMIVFQVFDQIEEEQPVDKKTRIEEIIREGNSRHNEYFKDHVGVIALEVLQHYERMHLAPVTNVK